MWTNGTGIGEGKGIGTAKGAGILLVDADETVRLLVREYLEAQGYAVKDAGTAAEALRLAGCWGGGEPKALLTAMHLPDGPGDWLADMVRRRHPSGLAVVFLVYDEMSAAVLAGENRYVQKPFSFLELSEAIDGALEASRAAAGPASLAGYPRPRLGFD
jgi:DNA-binding response OmpR family regulator